MDKLWLCHDTKNGTVIPPVKAALNELFGLETVEELHMDIAEVKGAFNKKRMQYNASKLLSYLILKATEGRTHKDLVSLWVVSDDLYVTGLNFVFGVAHSGKAAVLSTYRLYSLDLVVKEAIHEMGHVFGLQHCTNNCVMQFSNSLAEAEAKPAALCERCRSLISFL